MTPALRLGLDKNQTKCKRALAREKKHRKISLENN